VPRTWCAINSASLLMLEQATEVGRGGNSRFTVAAPRNTNLDS